MSVNGCQLLDSVKHVPLKLVIVLHYFFFHLVFFLLSFKQRQRQWIKKKKKKISPVRQWVGHGKKAKDSFHSAETPEMGRNSTRCGTVTIPIYTPVRDIQAIPAGTERYNNNYMYINLISIIIIKQVFQQIRMVEQVYYIIVSNIEEAKIIPSRHRSSHFRSTGTDLPPLRSTQISRCTTHTRQLSVPKKQPSATTALRWRFLLQRNWCVLQKKSGNQKPGLGGGRCKRLKFWGFRDRDTRHRERLRVEDVWSVFQVEEGKDNKVSED